jgi:hypothetical protein
MLTISKPLSSGQAQSYRQREFNAKEQTYWLRGGVIAGEWQGRLASHAGKVSAEDFVKLNQGQHPQTGDRLVRQRASYEYQDADGKTVKTMEHRAGWDATFSAPKSVSLTALCRWQRAPPRGPQGERLLCSRPAQTLYASPHRQQSCGNEVLKTLVEENNNADNRKAGHLRPDYQPDRQPVGKRRQALG